ncbi:MAG: tetratricopeptide repeat protein [Bacteroidota bacterium]
MHLLKKISFLLLLALGCTGLYAQDNADEALAAQYFANGEFDKAAVLYEKLLDKTTQSPYYYDNLLTCYFKLKEFDKAEKTVKKQKKRFPDNPYYRVDLGFVYEKKGEQKDAEEEYEECLKKMGKAPAQEEIAALTNAFVKRDLYPWAIKTIEKARKLYNDNNIMALDLGSLYLKTGNKERMIAEYLNHLSIFPEEITAVQNNFLDRFTNDEDWKLLKKEILTRIQKAPDGVYTEMLLWLLVQQKDFYGAFLQFRALDKRNKEDGRRMIELADLAITNDALDVAVDCYKYIISLGIDKIFYLDARNGLLTVSYKKITETGEYDAVFMTETEKNYKEFIAEVGENYISAPAMRQLAHLYNYYFDKPIEAIELLKRAIEIPRMNKSFTAECKLELGDAYLVWGDIWEAQLLYGQVDKDFKDEPLGQEAKFRNARLSFYKGEFDWAQAQLEVLKSATSHLISNNAIELSMVIQDNYGFEDGDDSALMLYAEANLLLLRNAPDLALQKLDSIKIKYPTHSLNDEVLLSKARVYAKKKMFKEAVEYYTDVYTNFSYDILADNALFEAAELYERQLGDKEKAKELYEKLVIDYPGSLHTVEARKRFRRLRGDNIKDIPQDVLDYQQQQY